MSEKMRDDFEKWAQYEHGYCAGTRQDGTYYVTKINDMWQAWQASRAALVVELPGEVVCERVEYYYDGWNDAAAEARLALDEAGIKHK